MLPDWIVVVFKYYITQLFPRYTSNTIQDSYFSCINLDENYKSAPSYSVLLKIIQLVRLLFGRVRELFASLFFRVIYSNRPNYHPHKYMT